MSISLWLRLHFIAPHAAVVMHSVLMMISFEDARKIAHEAARTNLRQFCDEDSVSYLSEEYLESDTCWLFFRNKDIGVPPESSLKADWSYAVSRQGELREFYDIDDKTKMAQAFMELSEKFRGVDPNA